LLWFIHQEVVTDVRNEGTSYFQGVLFYIQRSDPLQPVTWEQLGVILAIVSVVIELIKYIKGVEGASVYFGAIAPVNGKQGRKSS
jgi:hypothetical protein